MVVFFVSSMRLGLVELSLLVLLSEAGGYLRVSKLKALLSDYPCLTRGVVPASRFYRVRSIHVSVLRALRSLSSKGLVSLDCKGSRVVGVTLNVKGIVECLALRSPAIRRALK